MRIIVQYRHFYINGGLSGNSNYIDNPCYCEDSMQRHPYTIHKIRFSYTSRNILSRFKSVTLTKDKIIKVTTMCAHFINIKQSNIRKIGSLTRTLIWTFPGFETGPLFLPGNRKGKRRSVKNGRGESMMPVYHLPKRMKRSRNGGPLASQVLPKKNDHGRPEGTLTTDASLLGWG